MQSLNLSSGGSPLLAIFMPQDGEAWCCCGINGLYLRRYSKEGKEKDLGKVNAVVVYDKKDEKERRRNYVTPLGER